MARWSFTATPTIPKKRLMFGAARLRRSIEHLAEACVELSRPRHRNLAMLCAALAVSQERTYLGLDSRAPPLTETNAAGRSVNATRWRFTNARL